MHKKAPHSAPTCTMVLCPYLCLQFNSCQGMSLPEPAHLEQAESSKDSCCFQLGTSSTDRSRAAQAEAGRSRGAQTHSNPYLYGDGFRCLCTMPLCRAQTHTAVKEAGKFSSLVRFWGTAPAVPVSVSAYPVLTPLLEWILTENTGIGTQSFSGYSSR